MKFLRASASPPSSPHLELRRRAPQPDQRLAKVPRRALVRDLAARQHPLDRARRSSPPPEGTAPRRFGALVVRPGYQTFSPAPPKSGSSSPSSAKRLRTLAPMPGVPLSARRRRRRRRACRGGDGSNNPPVVSGRRRRTVRRRFPAGIDAARRPPEERLGAHVGGWDRSGRTRATRSHDRERTSSRVRFPRRGDPAESSARVRGE